MPTDPLPSWNDGPAKRAITQFVDEVAREGAPRSLPPRERIAVFDDDGTLWCEQPVRAAAALALASAAARVNQQPELRGRAPFDTLLEGGLGDLAAGGERAIGELLAAVHADLTTDEFEALGNAWLRAARHPRFARPYTELVYQPMLELLAYLRSRGFKNFVLSSSSIDLVRLWMRKTYGVPPAQIIGSAARLELEMRNDRTRLRRLATLDATDEGPGKPASIHRFVGQRPILAFGNSDGDLPMLQYTDSGSRPRLMLLLHHDDETREYACDRDAPIGRLDKALTEAQARRWTVVSVKSDFKEVFGSYGA